MKRGDIYSLEENNFTLSPILDDGIYSIMFNPMMGFSLNRIADKFEFGFKLYGLDEKLITHVLNTYNKQETKHNLGVLLNGAKGTGKTVTAKYLANKLGLPVIICDAPHPGLATFLASINQDCVFFFDEFEKNFSCGNDDDCAGEDLLSIMDGVYSGNNCHVFLLTTNELRINDNLLSRPSRIRYLKSFGDVISRNILEEYIDDNLIKKEYKEEILDFVDSLTMVTIDIVKSIVDEINLHDCHIDEFKQFFNVKEAVYRYYVHTWWVHKYGKEWEEGIDKRRFLKSASSYVTRDDMEKDPELFKVNYDNLTTNKPIKNYKVGQQLSKGSRYYIKEMDLEKNYVLLGDKNDIHLFKHIYFDNIDAKPSLYSEDDWRRNIDEYADYYD